MPDWLLQLITVFGAAAGVYAGIRYDMGRLTAKIESHKERLDRLENRVYK